MILWNVISRLKRITRWTSINSLHAKRKRLLQLASKLEGILFNEEMCKNVYNIGSVKRNAEKSLHKLIYFKAAERVFSDE